MIHSVGQELKPLSKPAITVELLQKYASASGDTNPIHLDAQFAKQAGYPSVIAHGMLSMAFLADGVCFNFPESQYFVESVSARFKRVTFPGDVLTVHGKIKNHNPETRTVTAQLWIENQKGEVTTQGEARVRVRSAGALL